MNDKKRKEVIDDIVSRVADDSEIKTIYSDMFTCYILPPIEEMNDGGDIIIIKDNFGSADINYTDIFKKFKCDGARKIYKGGYSGLRSVNMVAVYEKKEKPYAVEGYFPVVCVYRVPYVELTDKDKELFDNRLNHILSVLKGEIKSPFFLGLDDKKHENSSILKRINEIKEEQKNI